VKLFIWHDPERINYGCCDLFVIAEDLESALAKVEAGPVGRRCLSVSPMAPPYAEWRYTREELGKLKRTDVDLADGFAELVYFEE